MSDHSFNPLIAKKYGVHQSIFINTAIFWTRTNAASNKNFHNDRYWFFGTPEYFAKFFMYLTPRQIKYTLEKLVKDRLLIKGNFNKQGYDRTCWYSLSDELLNELNLDKTCLQTASGLIRQFCPSHRTILSNGSDKIVRPIPDTKPDTKPVTKKTCVANFKDTPGSTHTQSANAPPSKPPVTDYSSLEQAFDAKFSDREVTWEELLSACKTHYEARKTPLTFARVKAWVTREKPENYAKKAVAGGSGVVVGGDVAGYQEYVTRIRSAKALRLPAGNVEILDFNAWRLSNGVTGHGDTGKVRPARTDAGRDPE